LETDLNKKLATDVNSALKDLEYDVTQRNDYINTREKYLYGAGLYENIDFEVGQWFAEYNYLKRVVDIHAAQLMGRGFNVYSYYDKEDLSPYEGNEDALHLAVLRNKKAKASADARKKAVDAIIRDNGGLAKFKDGAQQGSGFGTTAFKMWYDKKEKKIKYVLLESPQNYRAFWTDSDFRERDADAYVWQISEDKAYRDYGSKLGPNETFNFSKFGEPFTLIPDTSRTPQTERKMVTIIDFTGYLKGYKASGDKVVPCKRGDETRINILIVGGKVVQTITEERYLPNYYLIPNRVEVRRAWGASDLPQAALDINQEIVQLEADSMTWANKNLFKLIKAKGFTPESIPKKKPRKQQAVAMAPEQDLVEMETNNATLQEFRSLIDAKMDAFVRVTGVGRVLFDDPSVNTGSNQALITTLKPVIDVVEDKQSRWEPVLVEMFTKALKLAAEDIPELKEAVNTDEDWFLCIEWPSVLRREDATYQTMWLNLFNANAISLETYHEKLGLDYSEEMDRLRDELTDKIPAAVISRQLGLLASQLISPPAPVEPQKKININVNAKTESGDPVTNAVIEEALGGPGGEQAVDQMIQPEGSANPQITPDQNTTQPVSQPGTGQPQVSGEGAVAQQQQNAGA
jgi:hypothetical protein